MDKKRILIVDDEPHFTEMVKLNLEAGGQYSVFVENRGTQALHSALVCKPHLILLDVIMPDKEGPDVLDQLKRHERARNIPVVFLTATVTEEEVREHQGHIGGRTFLAKPGTVRSLVECIEHEIALSV